MFFGHKKGRKYQLLIMLKKVFVLMSKNEDFFCENEDFTP